MVPTSFAQSNTTLDRPPGMKEEDCAPLSVFIGESPEQKPVTISCWKLTKEDLELIVKTGRVWLWVHGHGMPAVTLDCRNPFELAPNSSTSPAG